MKKFIIIYFVLIFSQCTGSEFGAQYKMFAAEEYLKKNKCSEAIKLFEEVSLMDSSYRKAAFERVIRLKKGYIVLSELQINRWYYKENNKTFKINSNNEKPEEFAFKNGTWYSVCLKYYKKGDDPETSIGSYKIFTLYDYIDDNNLLVYYYDITKPTHIFKR